MKGFDTEDGKWAVMLCGGFGNRMGSLTSTTPKPMLLVHDRPIIWYSFWMLYQKGFRNFILPIGYLGHLVEEYIIDISKNVDCNIYCVDTGIETPIASRIEKICHLIPKNKDFFLLNTDTIFNFDVVSMYEHHVAKKALVTLSSVEVVSPWGILTVFGDDIVGFDRERKVQKLLSGNNSDGYGVVNSGLAWINKTALSLIDFKTIGDFETDLFNAVIRERRMSHFVLDGIWFPIDTPKDLEAINYNMKSGESESSTLKSLLRSISMQEGK